MKHKITLLTGKNVTDLVKMKDAIKVVRQAFIDHTEGKLRMPSKVYLDLPEFNGDFRAMPAFSALDEMAGIKWVNSHTENQEKGIPSVMGTMILNDATNGLPVAVLDATILTNIRTGAAGGVAVDALAQKKIDIAAFVGCGNQAIYQLDALLSVRKPNEIRFFDPAEKSRKAFQKHASRHFKGKLVSSASIEECVHGAQVITTTTPSREPILRNEWIAPGAHINAIGADAKGKQELDPEILKRSRIYLDDREQASHSGEINVPLASGLFTIDEIKGTIGSLLLNTTEGRGSENDITVFDSTGLAIQDIALASFVVKKARKAKKGKLFRLL